MSFNRNAFPANPDGGYSYAIGNVNPQSPIVGPEGTGNQVGFCSVLPLPPSSYQSECVPNGRRIINVELIPDSGAAQIWNGYRVDFSQICPKFQIDAIRSVIVDFSWFYGLPASQTSRNPCIGIYSELTDFSLISTSVDGLIASKFIWNIPAIQNDSYIILIENLDACTPFNPYTSAAPLPVQIIFCNWNQAPSQQNTAYDFDCLG
jgi:hypothetical protein